MRLMSVLAIATLAFSVAANSADKKAVPLPKAWTQEPDSFMGVSFNKKLEYSLPLCPQGYQVGGAMCRDTPYQNYYTIKHGPDIGIGYRLGAMTSGDAVDSFYLTTGPDRFNDLVDIFIRKYGQPSERIPGTVKTKAGAQFADEVLLWKGKVVSIVMKKYDGDIETSSATVETNASVDRDVKKNAQSKEGGASKL